MENKHWVLIGGGIALLGIGAIAYKLSSGAIQSEDEENINKSEDWLGDEVVDAEVGNRISKKDILTILKKGKADYELSMATWHKVSHKMAPKNQVEGEKFLNTMKDKILNDIEVIDSKNAKEQGYDLTSLQKELEILSTDPEIGPILDWKSKSIEKISKGEKPEFDFEKIEGVDEEKFLK